MGDILNDFQERNECAMNRYGSINIIVARWHLVLSTALKASTDLSYQRRAWHYPYRYICIPSIIETNGAVEVSSLLKKIPSCLFPYAIGAWMTRRSLLSCPALCIPLFCRKSLSSVEKNPVNNLNTWAGLRKGLTFIASPHNSLALLKSCQASQTPIRMYPQSEFHLTGNSI